MASEGQRYEVRWADQALNQLRKIRDKRVQRKILEVGESLSIEPNKKGKKLSNELAGCRSIRAVGQRYRILYRVHEHCIEVVIITVGIRKEGEKGDVYRIAEALLRSGKLFDDLGE